MANTPNAPSAQEPFVTKGGFISTAWFQWLLKIVGAATTGGTVTHTGTLTSGKLIQGNGGADITVNATTATVTKLTSGTPSAATPGTDYVAPGSITSDGITMNTARLLGRTTASAGAVEEISVGTGLSLSAGSLTATGGSGTVTTTGSPASGNLTKFSGASSITNGDLSGDVTTSGTLVTTIATNAVTTAKIANSAVTYAKIQNVSANSRVLGASSTGSGAPPSELSLGSGLAISGSVLNTVGGTGGSGNVVYSTAVGSEPGSPNTGDLDLYTNSTGGQARYSGSAWIPWGPVYAFTKPDDSQFAWVNQGGATVTTTNGGIYLFAPATAGTSLRIRKKSISTNTVLTVGFLISTFAVVTNGGGGILLRESGTGKVFQYKINNNATVAGVYGPSATNLTTSAWTANNTLGGAMFWFRVALSGSNYVFSLAADSQNFITIATVAKTTPFTSAADEWGFALDTETASQDMGMTVLSFQET